MSSLTGKDLEEFNARKEEIEMLKGFFPEIKDDDEKLLEALRKGDEYKSMPKVEYKDGFLNKEEKELKYKYVREVTMSQNILERLCCIGTIRIFTNASSGVYNGGNHGSMRGRNGIYIHCVDDVEEQYKIIKQIIDEGTPEE